MATYELADETEKSFFEVSTAKKKYKINEINNEITRLEAELAKFKALKEEAVKLGLT